jgi:glycosyltransferase involved in cell wall biosynthesis
MQLKVLVLNDFASINGGSDAAAIASTAALHGAGVDVAFFGGAGVPDDGLRGIPITAPRLPDVHGAGAALRRLSVGLWHRAAESAVRSFIRKHAEPGRTVVHIQNFTKVLSPSVLAVVKATGLPTVVTAHDYFSFCPNGNYFNYSKAAPCRLEPLSLRCCLSGCDSIGGGVKSVRLARAGIMKATQTYGACFEATIAVSKLSAEILRGFAPRASVHVVRNLLPKPEFTPPSQDGGVVYVGRLTRSKGVVALARASKTARVRITFVGDGEAKNEVLAENPDAIVTGWMASEVVRKHILGSKALVLPSLWYETFGLTVAEGLALGRPVIVSERAGSSELVSDEVNGLVWRGASEEHLVSCLRRLNDKAVARTMSEAAARIYLSQWLPPQNHAEQLLEVYRGVVNTKKGSIEQRKLEAAAGR